MDGQSRHSPIAADVIALFDERQATG
jgi:hypothetical protein